MFATRSLKALVATVALVIALFVVAAPAYARPGNGNGHKTSTPTAPSYADLCALYFPGQTCIFIGLS